MPTAVLLVFADGRKEFVPQVHVHGVSEGRLLLATGEPGAGLDADVVREVVLDDVTYVETCERDDDLPDGVGGTWSISWPGRDEPSGAAPRAPRPGG